MRTRTSGNARHHWIDAAGRDDRAAVIAGLAVPPPLLAPVSAHRRLRGPYTAAGTIMRALAADALQRFPALVAAHEIELRCVTPELRGQIPATTETLTSLAVPAERTRFYSRLRTLRIAHGLTEFLRDYARAIGEPRSIIVDDVDAADQTDQELVSILLRRLDPDLLTLVIGTGGAPSPHDAAEQRAADPLYEALARYAQRPEAAAARDLPPVTDSAERRSLHDARAAELIAAGQFSLRLGAIPYHRERGSDPGGAGAEALREALDYCIDMGFYEATVDLGRRGRALIDWQRQPDLWWTFTTKMTTSLAALGRAAEAERLYDEARASTASAAVHMQAAYATAMLYTRHHEQDRRDDGRALGWINEAIAIAQLLPDAKVSAMQTVFNQNGLALIKSHQGDREDALRLVGGGLARLDSDLDPHEHRLHSSVLRYNRAQLYAGLGRLEEALADYTAVIEEDPHYAEYHFDRAALLRRLERDDEAMAEYETAMRLSPPFPELYYNRGDLRSALGDEDGALADFGYVLEIDPGYVDAYINRVAILMEAGHRAAARSDLAAGLTVAPDDPHLLCLLARLELEEGHRASDPAMLFNRALAHQALGNWAAAEADFTAVLDVEPGEDEARLGRAECRRRLGKADSADSAGDELRQAAAMAPDHPAAGVMVAGSAP